jgi:hypothetical protein
MNYELKIFYTEDVTKSARLLILKNTTLKALNMPIV